MSYLLFLDKTDLKWQESASLAPYYTEEHGSLTRRSSCICNNAIKQSLKPFELQKPKRFNISFNLKDQLCDLPADIQSQIPDLRRILVRAHVIVSRIEPTRNLALNRVDQQDPQLFVNHYLVNMWMPGALVWVFYLLSYVIFSQVLMNDLVEVAELACKPTRLSSHLYFHANLTGSRTSLGHLCSHAIPGSPQTWRLTPLAHTDDSLMCLSSQPSELEKVLDLWTEMTQDDSNCPVI